MKANYKNINISHKDSQYYIPRTVNHTTSVNNKICLTHKSKYHVKIK